MMVISSSRISLSTIECDTLKEKRSIVKSVINSVRSKFNVSIAEIENNNTCKHAVIGLVFVSNEKKFSEEVLSGVVDFINRRYPGRLEDYDLDIYSR